MTLLQNDDTDDTNLDTPFSTPDDVPKIDPTHPVTDSEMDSDEAYQEGNASAAGLPAEPDPDTKRDQDLV